MTKAHLLRGLMITTEVDDKGHPGFRFDSVAGADDFTRGVVGITVRERFLKTRETGAGEKKLVTARKALAKHFRSLSKAVRLGREVVCSLPMKVDDYPATLDFDEDHGYAWTASYVYPRKYWTDVRVDWELEVGLLI